MPEFHLIDSDARDYRALDPFTQGYIAALFFTESNCTYDSEEWRTKRAQRDIAAGRVSGEIPKDLGFEDIDSAALESIKADCARFQKQHGRALELAYRTGARYVRGGSYGAELAGHDFWLTRNGHGTGFWDRGLIQNARYDLGDILSTYARRFGESSAYYGDDGRVHVS